MNMSASECSSGCESGWTAYLEQSSRPAYDETRKSEKSGKSKKAGLQEDKDLSMVSDASSGPRLDCNNDVEEHDDSFQYNSYYVSAPEQGKTRKPVKNSHLDDTASSPVLSSPKASSIKHDKRPSYLAVIMLLFMRRCLCIYSRRTWPFPATNLPQRSKNKVFLQHVTR